MKTGWDLSIGQRLGIGFGISALLLVALIGVVFAQFERIGAMETRQQEILLPRVESFHALEKEILSLAVAVRNQLLFEDEAAAQTMRRQMKRLHETLEHVEELHATTKDDSLSRILKVQGGGYLDRVNALLATGEATPRGDVRSRERQVREVGDDLLDMMRDQAKADAAEYNALAEETHHLRRRLRRIILAGTVLVLFLLGGTAFLTVERVRKPAVTLLRAAKRLASGDFSLARELAQHPRTSLAVSAHRDELQELERVFAGMSRSLQRRESALKSYASVGLAAAKSADLFELSRESTETIGWHVGAESAVFYRLEAGNLCEMARWESAGRAALGVSEEQELVHRAAREGAVVSTTKERELSGAVGEASEGTSSLDLELISSAVPVMWPDETPLGALVVSTPHPLDSDEVSFLVESARLMALGIKSVLANLEIKQLVADLVEKQAVLEQQNQELSIQKQELVLRHKEIRAQNQEIQEKSEALQGRHEEIQAQHEEMMVQADELRRQTHQLRTTMEMLKRSEERFRRAMTNAPFPVMLFSEDGKVVLLSETWIERSGYSSTEIPTVSAWCRRAMGDSEEADRLIALARGLEASQYEAERRIITKEGEARIWIFRTTHLGGDVGACLAITMAIDVTERRQAEDALREADARKNDFLAMLSHELRNPLAPIKNCLFLIAQRKPTDERTQRAFEVIERQVGYLSRLVDDLLDVTRITRGKIQLQNSTLDLPALVDDVIRDYVSAFEHRGVILESHHLSGSVEVVGDPVRLAQIIGNLLQNALKFTQPGGHVQVQTERLSKNVVALKAKDDGVGIEPGVLSRLFQPFIQADNSLERTGGGLGLGLALVRGLVELHGGRVFAHSEGVGHGAEFVAEFPIAQVEGKITHAEGNPP